MAISNHKLNPLAIPYVPCMPLRLHQIRRPLPLPPQPPAVVAYGLQPYFLPSTTFSPCSGTVAYYNTHRQPLPAFVESSNCSMTLQPLTGAGKLGTFLPCLDDKAAVPKKKVVARSSKPKRWKRYVGSRFFSRKSDGGGSFEEKSWVPKRHGSKEAGKIASPVRNDWTDDQACSLEGKTTLMIRNIPNHLKRQDLLQVLDEHCIDANRKNQFCNDSILSRYDFFYLPMDFSTGSNLGYAFVNFTNEVAASRFRDAFHKSKWQISKNKKICEVASAVIQGKEALRNHFKKSLFPCSSDSYLPVVLSPPRDGLSDSILTTVGQLQLVETNRKSRSVGVTD